MKKTGFLKKACMILLALTVIGTSLDMSAVTTQAAAKKTVTLTSSKKTIITGESFTLKVKKVKGLSSSKVTFKSSNTKVAKVSSSKSTTSVKIKALKAGTVTITATSSKDKKIKATCKITVNQAVTKVTMNTTKATLGYKKTMQLVSTATPTSAKTKTVKWKSYNTKVATVNSKGVVTTKSKAGTAKITAIAKDGSGKKATCKVTVKKKVTATKSVKLSKSSVKLNVGKSTTLKATIAPTKATLKNVYWTSSNTKYVTVDQNGKITAVKAGTATITATAMDGSKKKATCKVKVTSPSISLNSSSATINADATMVLTATVKDALGTTVKWSTSDSAVATVSSSGVVKGIKAGTVTITAKAKSGKKATCKVTVIAPSVSLNSSSANVNVGATTTLTAMVKDALGTTVTWSTSDSTVATVSASGVVTGIKAGTATITAKSVSGKTATCKVTVKNSYIATTGITLNKTDEKVEMGKTLQLTATVAPSNATDATVEYESSDEDVATVSDAGLVVVADEEAAVSQTVTITAMAADGQTATCEIYVTGSKTANLSTDTEYVFAIDQKASDYTIAYSDVTKTITSEEMTSDITTFMDKFATVADEELTGANLEKAWDKLTAEAINSNQNIADATIVSDTDMITGARYKTITATVNGKSKTVTVTVPAQFSDDKAANTIVINEGLYGDTTRVVTISNVSLTRVDTTLDGEEDSYQVEFTATDSSENGFKTETFKATVKFDLSNATIVDEAGNEVLSYTNEDGIYTLQMNKAFYEKCVETFNITRSLEDIIITNNYK